MPLLPIVIPPYPGEALSNWVRAIAGTYELQLHEYLTLRGFLTAAPKGRSNLERSSLDRRLTICPDAAILDIIQADTGIDMATLRAMTFLDAEVSLYPRCHRHQWFCPACRDDARHKAGRSIELRNAMAAWCIFCPDHPPQVARLHYIDERCEPEPFYELARQVLDRLAEAAFEGAQWDGIFGSGLGRCRVAAFLAVADLFNDRVTVKIIGYNKAATKAVFSLVSGTPRMKWERTPFTSRPYPFSNDLIVSLVFAWQIMQDPSMAIYVPVGERHGPPGTDIAARLCSLVGEGRELLSGRE